MANVTDSSSLLVVPSGWSDGVLGSLKPDDGTGDFTFSRGSDLSATRVNENGYIERGHENLLLQSNNFDLSPWNSNPVLTPNQLGYDGSDDAWLVEKLAAFNNVAQAISLSGVQTFSIYAKAGTQEWLRLRMSGAQTCYYHLFEDGDTGLNSGTINQSIESIGNGWYRCSMTISATTSSVNIYSAEDDAVMGTSGSIYIQDAMLNQGLVAYPYVETTTTTAKSTTILEDQPRIDYTSGNGAVLIEPSGTNLITQSEYILDGFTSNQCAITATNENNPSGLPFSYTATAISSVNDRIRYRFGTTTGKYYFSVFIKGDGTTNRIRLRGLGTTAGADAYWNIYPDGSVVFDTNVSSENLNPITQNFGNNWYRIGYVVEYNGFQASYIDIVPSNLNVTSSVYLWGLQMEQDATYSSSYIPTYGTSSTRAKDTATLTKSVASTGTIYININSNSTKTLTFLGGNVSVTQGVNKIAMSYSPTALKISHNGSIVQNITRTFDTSALTQVQLGHRNNFEQTTDSINQFLTLDSFLTDTKLNELTA